MKNIYTNGYSFNAATKQIDFVSFSGFNYSRLVAVINLTQNKILYATGATGKGGTYSGTVLTLEWDTTTYSNGDTLQIIYGDAPSLYTGLTDAELRAAPVPVNGTIDLSSTTLTALENVSIDNFPASQNVVVTSSVLPTGAATQTTLAAIDTKLAGTLAVSGPLTDTQLRATPVAVSLAGSATSALQTAGNASLSSIDTKTPALGQALAAASVPVVLTAIQLAALTPITGGATEANQVLELVDLAAINSNTSQTASRLNNVIKNTVDNDGTGNGAAPQDVLVAGIYKSSPPTLLNGDQSELILDENGSLKVSGTAVVSGEVSLDATTIAAIQPNSVQVIVAPTVTSPNGQIAGVGSPAEDIIKVGGWDENNNEHRELHFADNRLIVVDATTSSIVASIDAKTPNLGQAAMSASTPVTIASNQSAIPVTGTFFQATQPISVISLPLPSGASTSSLQTTGNTSLSSIDTKLTNNATTTLQTTGNTSLSSIDTKLTTTNTSLNSIDTKLINNATTTLQTTGNTSLSSIDTKLTTTNASLASIDAGIPAALGTAALSASMPVALSDGLSSQTTLVAPAINADLLTGVTSTTAWFDLQSFTGGSIQIISTTAVGSVQFEQSNDNTSTTGVSLPVQVSASTNTATIGSIAISTTAQVVEFSSQCRYVRARLSVAATGTVTTTFYRRQIQPKPNNAYINGGTLGTLSTVSTVSTVTAVTAVSSSQTAAPIIVADVVSAALTTTTTTSAILLGSGIAYQVNVPVTVVSGTAPTYDLDIQESDDSGANWYHVYSFPRITTTGIYRSPILMTTGNRIRYVQTISGTTPSFTRSINRLVTSQSLGTNVTQLINRSVDLNTMNSVTPSLRTQQSKNCQLVINIGTSVVVPTLQLEGTDDNGLSWYSIGTPLNAVASSTVQVTVSSMNAQLIRARVSSAGTTAVIGYVLVKGF